MAKTNEKELSLQESLIAIQSKLKAPKNQYNSFGKYKYRSAEDILEAVKPLLAEHNVVLNMSDRVELIGTRYYTVSTAKVIKGEEEIISEGRAREDESKKGMDGAQVTGASSSYARKYALNGLFCIDDTKDADTKDADTDEYTKQQQAAPKQAAKPAPKPAAQPTQPAPQPYPELDLEKELLAESEVNQAQSSTELTAIWNKYTLKSSPHYHPAFSKEGVFRKAVAARGQQLKAEGK